MSWTTLTLEVVTPLFNGGADPDGSAGIGSAADAGIRPGSIRGAMRFWFRAMSGALVGDDLRLLGAVERRVFGGVAGPGDDGSSAASPLILRLPDPPSSRDYSLPGDRDAAWVGYLLGLGLMRPARGGPRLLRPCVAPGNSFELKLRFRHSRGTTGPAAEAAEAVAFASLWLACAYGGFGARARRGFGGVRITDASGELPGSWSASWLRTPGVGLLRHPRGPWPWPPEVFGVFERHLPELIRAEGGAVGKLDAWAEVPSYPVLSKTYSPSAVVPEDFATWHGALAYAGRQLRLFRANRPGDDARRRQARVRTAEWDDVIKGQYSDFPVGALGLPVGYQEKDTQRKFTVNAVKPGGPEPEELRRASPLWLRPVGSGSSWGLLTFAFRSRFLPADESASVYLLPNRPAIHDGWRREQLFVEQENVTDLTEQWLAAMRAGGDFTTKLRDLSAGRCTMPTLIEMRLKTSWTLRPDTRQQHGLACALFEDEHSEHLGRDKPFAIWPVRPVPGGPPEAWEWRAAWLPDTPLPASAVATDMLRIGHVTCAVAEMTQRRVTHASLADGQALSTATITFGSATYFSQNGTDAVVPDPRLIASSWRRRWNASLADGSPLVIDDQTWKETSRLVGLDAFDLRTEARDTGHGRDRLGFTGTATLRLSRNAPVRARKIFGTLARFAGYCGTGAQTTHGFGATSLAVGGSGDG